MEYKWEYSFLDPTRGAASNGKAAVAGAEAAAAGIVLDPPIVVHWNEGVLAASYDLFCCSISNASRLK